MLLILSTILGSIADRPVICMGIRMAEKNKKTEEGARHERT